MMTWKREDGRWHLWFNGHPTEFWVRREGQDALLWTPTGTERMWLTKVREAKRSAEETARGWWADYE